MARRPPLAIPGISPSQTSPAHSEQMLASAMLAFFQLFPIKVHTCGSKCGLGEKVMGESKERESAGGGAGGDRWRS